ncbi:hypothetical protein WX45_03201 [Clostridium ljungdahlii DSM 13528]|uniref:Uncharacterized protein n=1 Tax=Clostridium ljungdahlii (strain ATCC 55383 / DSM 13528 / PETC) TaxID=748727 RepID=A0ABX2TVB0_CLOLD|nr:Hypothetical protein CLAU_3958 [Clostridium autoethanogenum DSM 10061]OAA87639.1 hypothetical protein WX45_03201 [Clostridium ljungdahlii DSM 13528]OVY51141.1 hypothetical protein WX72_02303 [Clostridium autoethanogenum]
MAKNIQKDQNYLITNSTNTLLSILKCKDKQVYENHLADHKLII